MTPVAASPCADTLLVRLKEKGLDNLSEREYEYFTKKDAECARYLQREEAERQAEQKSEFLDLWVQWEKASAALVVLLVFVLLMT
jgi:hypothetical protein